LAQVSSMQSLTQNARPASPMQTRSPLMGRPSQASPVRPRSNISVTDVSTVESTTSRRQESFERRIAWLEEDVAMLHRRLRDECKEGNIDNTGDPAAKSDHNIVQLVKHLDEKLAAEGLARQELGARVLSVENGLTLESCERKDTLSGFSLELQTAIQAVIEKIDQGLTRGAATVREQTQSTEERIRFMMKKVNQSYPRSLGSEWESKHIPPAPPAPLPTTPLASIVPGSPIASRTASMGPPSVGQLSHSASVQHSLGASQQQSPHLTPGRPLASEHRLKDTFHGTAPCSQDDALHARLRTGITHMPGDTKACRFQSCGW